MKLLKVANWFWQSVGTIALFAGWIISFSLPAWAIQASKLFSQYQPASSVAAGFAGALTFGLVVRFLAAAKEAWVSAGVKDRFYRDGDRINPLARHFEQKRINIADLVPPMGGAIRDKTFDGCELIGPANIVLAATGAGVLHGNTFTKCDAVSTAEGAQPQTAVGFFNCRFVNCHFFDVTLFIHEGIYHHVNQAIGNLNWVTPEPTPSAVSALGESNEPATLPTDVQVAAPD